eukprot:gene28133-biopygen32085
MQWGLGVEHEFNVSLTSSPLAQTLLPSKVLPEYGGSYYSLIKNDESVSAVRAPAGVDLDTKAIREHLKHIAGLDGLFLDSEKAKPNASRSLSIQTFMRKQGKDTVQTSIYSGDTLFVTCCYDDIYSITVIPNEKRPSTPLSDEDTLRSLCALRAVKVSKKSQQQQQQKQKSKINKSYDVDGPFLETRSTKHNNTTVAGVARQLHDAEAAVLARANEEGITGAQIFPWSGRITPKGEALYEGSLHVWVTLLHDRNVDMTLREFKLLQLQHAYLGHVLQTVEPLLRSLFSGDPRALGDDKNTHNRASMRADTSNFAGYGTTAVKYIARGPDVDSITGFQVMWFENESDMLARRGARMQRDDMSKLFVWIDGKKVPFTACIGSHMRNGYYYPNYTWNIPLHKSPEAGTGADIRSRLCDSLDMSLKKGWVPLWLRVRDTLELRFVHGEGTPKVKVSRNAPIDARRWGKELVGIEFRAIDNMPTHQIDHVLHLVVLLGAAAVSQVEKIWHDNADSDPDTQAFFATHAATLSPHWNAALDAVRKQGAHAPLPKAYTTYIASQTGISSLKTRNASATAFGALQDFARSLHAEYFAHSVTALMHPRSNDEGPPAFSNTNQEAWEAISVDGIVILRCMKKPVHMWYWHTCVHRIRAVHPTMPVVIVDDHSDPDMRAACIPIEGTIPHLTVIESDLQAGAGEILPLYYMFTKRLFETALVIHDAMFLNQPIPESIALHTPGFRFLWHFSSNFRHEEATMQTMGALSSETQEEIMRVYNNGGEWLGCFGTAMYVTLDTLDCLKTRFSGITKLAATVNTRSMRSGLERVIPLMLMIINDDESSTTCVYSTCEYSVFGDIFLNHPMPFKLTFENYMQNTGTFKNRPVVKVWSER